MKKILIIVLATMAPMIASAAPATTISCVLEGGRTTLAGLNEIIATAQNDTKALQAGIEAEFQAAVANLGSGNGVAERLNALVAKRNQDMDESLLFYKADLVELCAPVGCVVTCNQ